MIEKDILAQLMLHSAIKISHRKKITLSLSYE